MIKLYIIICCAYHSHCQCQENSKMDEEKYLSHRLSNKFESLIFRKKIRILFFFFYFHQLINGLLLSFWTANRDIPFLL